MQLYAVDKSPQVSSAMFWTAVDILKVRVEEGRVEEANKILLALDRLLPNVPDREGWVQNAYESCERLLRKTRTKKAGYFTTPEQAVDWQKRRNLRYAINHYVKFRRIGGPIRFDIITVVGTLGTYHPVINHFEDVDIMR